MQEEFSSAVRLEQTLSLLHRVHGALQETQASLLRGNLAEWISRQRDLCESIKPIRCIAGTVDTSPSHDFSTRASSLVKHWNDRGPQPMLELKQLTEQVLQSSQTYASILRKVLRTSDIFCRILASSEITYRQPLPVGATPRKGVTR